MVESTDKNGVGFSWAPVPSRRTYSITRECRSGDNPDPQSLIQFFKFNFFVTLQALARIRSRDS
jgi:hypothetical protein